MSGHHLELIFLTLFAWPAGIVLGNLLASLLWVPIQAFGIQLRLRAHHKEMHARLDSQDTYILERFDRQDAVLAVQNAVLDDIQVNVRRSQPDLLPPDGCP